MLDPELLERITARRAELDELEEQPAKQLAEVRTERDELAVAERALETGERADRRRAGLGRAGARAGGRSGGDDHILAHLRAVGLGALADPGFRGLDNDVRDPVIVTGSTATRAHELTPGQKTADRVLAVGRAPVEHGFAHLKNWRTLTKLRTDPARATHLLRALLVLTNLEVNR
ncbi:transposase family protein [Streptomyces sp. NPDC029216]|uniref:transposase family protein n=1 Tax=Streptomyces sp. NPDC029216 TaxID=3154701 RepID=UPI0033D4D189